MSDWVTAISDLRTLLSDGETDRYNFRKQCFGEVNGTNLTFRTFEFRRITDFTSADYPLGVFINGNKVDDSNISFDYPETGEFTFASTGSAPQNGDSVEASYYNQWFIDSELNTFLVVAQNWLDSGSQYINCPSGLRPAVLKYAAAESYLKMAQRWRTWLSEMYRVEDQPQKPGSGPVESFIKMAETFRKEAETSRKEFFTRQDRNLQPLFGQVIGNVRPLP